MSEPAPVATSTDVTSGTWARCWIIVLAILCGVQTNQSNAPLAMALLLTGLLTLGTFSVTGRVGRGSPSVTALQPINLAVALVAVTGAAQLLATARQIEFGWPFVVLALGLVAAIAVVAAGRTLEVRRRGPVLLGAVLLVNGVAMVAVGVQDGWPVADVVEYVRHAVTELTHFRTPYGGSVPNPYDPTESAKYLTPEVLSGDGQQILVGYPYLPGTAITALVAHWLGSARMGGIGALALCGLCWWLMASDQVGRRLAVSAAVLMSSFAVVTNGYVDPYVALGVSVLALALVRGSRAGVAAATAYLIASKQYVALVIPFLWPSARRIGYRAMAAGVLIGGALDAAFWLWGPAPFWHDVVEFQLIQPLRPDSISLLVSLDTAVGPLPDLLFSVAPFVAGLLVSGYVAARGRPGATTTVAAFGLGLLASVLFSKQAFANYFLVVEAALITAAIAWPVDGPFAPLATSEGAVEDAAWTSPPPRT